MKQQEQTYSFFNKNALEWQKKAESSSYNIIADRHNAVLKTLSKLPNGSTLLDVGCGTGQLVIQTAEQGHEATGLDFAEEMIQIATENSKKSAATPKFICGSVFDFKPEQKFNLVSAQGFIEYISSSELEKFMQFLQSWVKPGGAFSIGSRNRLFNMATSNSFTSMEMKLGASDTLLQEIVNISEADSQEEMIQNLRKIGKNLIQPETHPMTGIEVNTRYQFTPSDLVNRFETFGFEITAIYPIHYHSFMPLALTDTNLKIVKDDIALSISTNCQTNHRLLPMASSFLIEGFLNA